MNAVATSQPVGVVLCRACARRNGLAEQDVADALRAMDQAVAVFLCGDLCRKPAVLPSALRGKGLARLVVGACADGEIVAEIRQAAADAGIDPFSVEVVDLGLGVLPRKDTGELSPQRAVAQLAARVERARAYEGVPVENLRLALPGMDEPMSRRGLFGLLRPRHQVVPAVDAGACWGPDRCLLCVSFCPFDAISVSGVRVAIDTFRCTGCGACLPACPASAIRYPTYAPAQTAAEVRGLLAVARRYGAESLGGLPVLLYGCRCAGRLPLPPGYLLVEVPCLAMLPADLLLLPFEEGAAGVLLAAGACASARSGAAAAWAGRVAYAQVVLEAFELGAARLGVWRRQAGEGPTPALHRFQKALEDLGPQRLAEGGAQPRDGGLPGLLGRWDRRSRATTRRLASDASPLGLVTVKREACTFCGICASHCPTGALAFEEKDGRATLSFAHARCVACNRCVVRCPEKAMALERATDLDRLNAPAEVIAEDSLARCVSCGASLLPEAIRRHVQARLPGFFASGTRESLCPACRIKGQLVGQMQAKSVSWGVGDEERRA